MDALLDWQHEPETPNFDGWRNGSLITRGLTIFGYFKNVRLKLTHYRERVFRAAAATAGSSLRASLTSSPSILCKIATYGYKP